MQIIQDTYIDISSFQPSPNILGSLNLSRTDSALTKACEDKNVLVRSLATTECPCPGYASISCMTRFNLCV